MVLRRIEIGGKGVIVPDSISSVCDRVGVAVAVNVLAWRWMNPVIATDG